jgi:competence protein ComEC
MTAFIAGGSFLFFLPQVPTLWLPASLFVGLLCLLALYLGFRGKWLRYILIFILLFSIGFAWNAHYADKRLKNILAEELEGRDLIAEGRVIALPQSSPASAKFAFELEHLATSKQPISVYPKMIYLSWSPGWRDNQKIPDIIPGQRWKF